MIYQHKIDVLTAYFNWPQFGQKQHAGGKLWQLKGIGLTWERPDTKLDTKPGAGRSYIPYPLRDKEDYQNVSRWQ